MFQIEIKNYASDALEDAMVLAQTKSLNSYTFSDCMQYLNYAWRDIYDRMAMIDDGYYGKTIQLKSKLTRLPPFVKNTLRIYAAQSPVNGPRELFRSSNNSDMMANGTYHISGTDLFCPDAERRVVWLYYIPICPQLFFTLHNRDPKLFSPDEIQEKRDKIFSIYHLVGTFKNSNNEDERIDISSDDVTPDMLKSCYKWSLIHRASSEETDISESIMHHSVLENEDVKWQIAYISCDFPYIFVSYQHNITGEYLSGFYTEDFEFIEYNPFAFTGRNSNVCYVKCNWNDKTGLGVVIKDYNDLDEEGNPRIKELGWTPDTLLNYPIPEVYRYLVARLADKFAALNESNVMGVQKELTEAKLAFESFLDRDKSAWKRIENANLSTVTDWI